MICLHSFQFQICISRLTLSADCGRLSDSNLTLLHFTEFLKVDLFNGIIHVGFNLFVHAKNDRNVVFMRFSILEKPLKPYFRLFYLILIQKTKYIYVQ